MPPDAGTGVKLFAAAPAVRVSAGIASVVEITEATVSEKVFEAVSEDASVTVTVYVVAELAAVGVPVIAPVELFIANPDGSEGETANEYGVVPREAVTGTNEEAVADTATDFDAML
ncbi:unannotated protein [freshwater metagenome]|uniref:Unannotated protein n=1 Tax=freshwater metagenome TaxID=449393 RepID=A0A6J5YVH4_9ZZZZ